jgi:hypothetical protein
MSGKGFLLVTAYTVFLLLFVCMSAYAEDVKIPDMLKPWTGWVLHGHEHETCTLLFANSDHVCQWSGPLSLDLTENGGTFEQTWTMETGGWIPVPGSSSRYPFEVTVNGEKKTPVLRQGAPAIYVKDADLLE